MWNRDQQCFSWNQRSGQQQKRVQGSKFSSFLGSGINILGKNMESVTKKYTMSRPVIICVSGYPRSIRFALNVRFLNYFSEKFVRRFLGALPSMAFGCSAQRLFRLSRRFERALVVFFALVGSKIVGWQPERIFLPPEMPITMSIFIKCNEQILGSTSFLNFLSARARLHKTSHFLPSSDFTGKQ